MVAKMTLVSLLSLSFTLVLQLPDGTSLKGVQGVIAAAVEACPHLLQLKRDARSFFSPSLHNIVVHSACLKNYIDITETVCNVMERR